MAWDDYRLETSSGEVIMFLAPNFTFEPSFTNDVDTNGLPGEGTLPLVLDLGRWTGEITAQGQFENSENFGNTDHRQELASLESSWSTSTPITASEQVHRLLAHLVYGEASPPYHLYLGEWEFTAASPGAVNPIDGVFPNVTSTEVRTPEEAGLKRNEWLLRFTFGTVEGAE